VLVVVLVAVVPNLRGAGSGADPAATTGDPTAPRDIINAALTQQGEALAAGDETAWLATVDPAQTALVATYRQRFEALRGLGASGFQASVAALPTPGADRTQWSANVEVSFCLAAPSCVLAKGNRGQDPAEQLRIIQRWQLSGSTALIEAETALVNGWTHLPAADPWLVSPLVYAVGARVVLAAPAALASRLTSVLKVADRAAANADLFNPGRHPARYVIYLAGKAEWSKWFNGREPAWAGGYTRRIAPGDAAVVVNMPVTPADYVERTLRHELGHVVTIGSNFGAHWWVTEGVAEYVDTWDIAMSHYDRLVDVRRYLRAHTLTDLDLIDPASKDADWTVDAYYGIACLAIRHLADTYGRVKTLAFVDDVEGGGDLEVAAQQRFGDDWASVQKAILVYVHKTAGA
jgi:hypothetical protein